MNDLLYIPSTKAGLHRMFVWYIDGAIAAGNGLGPIYKTDTTYELSDLTLNAKVAPLTTAASFDVQTATSPTGTWTSIFSVLPTIAAGSNVYTPGTLSVTSLPINTFIRYCVIAAGGTAAESVTAHLRAVTS